MLHDSAVPTLPEILETRLSPSIGLKDFLFRLRNAVSPKEMSREERRRTSTFKRPSRFAQNTADRLWHPLLPQVLPSLRTTDSCVAENQRSHPASHMQIISSHNTALARGSKRVSRVPKEIYILTQAHLENL